MTSAEVKKLTRKQLMKCVPTGFKFKTKPRMCQLASFVVGAANTGYNFWLDLGLGKSKTAIDLCRFLSWSYKLNLKVLVCCRNETAMGHWAEEVEKHSNLEYVLLTGDVKEKLEAYDNMVAGFCIIHYTSLRYMYCDKKKDTRKGKKETALRQVMNKPRLKNFGKYDCLVIDEAHKVKNARSVTFRILKYIINNQKVVGVYLLTGTPWGQTLLDIWGQYFLVDGGETFFPNKTEFTTAYFSKTFWGKQVVTKAGKKAITSRLFNKAIRYDESEAEDLPPKVFIKERFSLSEEQREVYNDLIAKVELMSFKGSMFEINNRTMAFRQICSGFLMHTLNGKKKRQVKYFDENPKLTEVFLPLIEEVINKTKVVIFHDFVVEGRMIEKELDKLKIQYSSLRGEIKGKYEQYRAFKDNDKIRAMVAHPQSGGDSIELYEATYVIMYSNPQAVIDRKQCIKRVHRPGQTQRTFIYDILGRKTYEETIYNRVNKLANEFSEVMDGKVTAQVSKQRFIDMLKGK